ncbi:hypothetical protein EIP86_000500 [Pleurotus ostreatoroseus]|nr:hypothetical protein EIP86_000500 [Pleurotus ostreatoroseus]
MKPARQDPGENLLQHPERGSVNVTFTFPRVPTEGEQFESSGAEKGEALDTGARHTAYKYTPMPLQGLSPAPVNSTLLSPISPATNTATLEPPEPPSSHVLTESSAEMAAGTTIDKLESGSIPISVSIGDEPYSISARRNETENEAPLPASTLTETRQSESKEASAAYSTISRPEAGNPFHSTTNRTQLTALPSAADRPSALNFAPRSVCNIAQHDDRSLAHSLQGITLPTITFAASPRAVPPVFAHMLEILEASRREGQPSLLRSHVALQLTRRNPAVYQEAGVTKFKDYAALAESMGLIELGGFQGTAWISLASSHLGA